MSKPHFKLHTNGNLYVFAGFKYCGMEVLLLRGRIIKGSIFLV